MVTTPKKELRAVELPPKKEMLKRLNELRISSMGNPEVDKFYEHYIEDISTGGKLNGHGLALTWERTKYDKGYNEVQSFMLDAHFERIMRTIVPPDVAEDAIELMARASKNIDAGNGSANNILRK